MFFFFFKKRGPLGPAIAETGQNVTPRPSQAKRPQHPEDLSWRKPQDRSLVA